MKKIILVMTTVLAMLVFMAFTCYGQGIKACYQKENGQLRILTYQRVCNTDCDKDRDRDRDRDHKKDCDNCDKDGYTNKCKPSEIPITLLGGGEIPEVPQICAGTVCYDSTTIKGECIQPITSFCATVNKISDGQYTITFTDPFAEYPICVFYTYPLYDPVNLSYRLVLAQYSSSINTNLQPPSYSEISVTTIVPSEGLVGVNSTFNFICTQP